MILDISQVAGRSGLPASTLRYYEDRGLICSIGRRGLRRTFEPSVLTRLALISLCRSAGFSLREIVTLLGDNDARSVLNRRALAAKADEIDAKIVRLSAMRDSLRQAVVCPEASHLDCDTFKRCLDDARKGQSA
jgi:DNA-binding transcriptional MerR regulator